jgi:hypothetical protein
MNLIVNKNHVRTSRLMNDSTVCGYQVGTGTFVFLKSITGIWKKSNGKQLRSDPVLDLNQ